MTLEGWLETHPWLRPAASFFARVEASAASLESAGPEIPPWDDYRADFLAGIPLLQSRDAPLDSGPAGAILDGLVGGLASDLSAGPFAEEIRAVHGIFRRDRDLPRRAVAWLLGDDSFTPPDPGLMRFLGWTAMRRYLVPLVTAFGAWRDEEGWLRRYCPTCGSAPAMAQLAGADPGRRRLLACGCCGTRWQFQRTECPFCANDSQRLSAVTVDGEGGLRIDFCESCRGYLKTYDGQGNEALLLSDWTSLHLDVIAADRGLKRAAASLYDFGSMLVR